MLELTDEQHRTLTQSGTEPVRALDPAAGVEYVLVPAEVYERIRHLLADDTGWLAGAHRASLEVFAREGWDDPRMSVYDAMGPEEPL